MKTFHTFLLGLILVLGTSPASAAILYDAFTDYSATSNPNGVWTFGYESAIAFASGGPLTVTFPDNANTNGSVTFNSWYDSTTPDHGYSTPFVGVLPAGTGFQNLGKLDNPNGTLVFHPGGSPTYTGGTGIDDQYVVIQWQAPGNGTVAVSGEFTSISGGSKTVFVTDGASTLFSSPLAGSPSPSSLPTVTYNSPGSLPVTAGETIDFVAGPPDSFFGDATAVTADVTFKPVPEPSTLVIWSVLAIVGLAVGRRGRRK